MLPNIRDDLCNVFTVCALFRIARTGLLTSGSESETGRRKWHLHCKKFVGEFSIRIRTK